MDESQIMKLMDKLSEMSERLARVETMLQANASEYKHINDTLIDHDERLDLLEQAKASAMSVKEVVAWTLAFGVALWGVLK